MPGTPAQTTRLQIPRYAGTDNVDFPAQVNAVSDRVDVIAGRFESGLLAARPSTGAGIADRYYYATDTGELYRDAGGATPAWVAVTPRSVATVAALPATPYDGQIVDYLVDAANGVVWRLRYRAASASPFKWEFLGGADLSAELPAPMSTTSTAYADLSTVGPLVTLPLAGDYLITFNASLTNSTANAGTFASPRLGAAATADYDSVYHVSATANAESAPSRGPMRRNGLAVAATVKLQYRVTIGTGTVQRCNLSVRPIRLG